MRINHNISAQLANVNLKKADSKMSSALERLSSGYKITKAADDAAGLAISNKMRTQIRALDQASRNADDGISIIDTAEGALSEIEAILQRTRELSVQAANDTCTIDDRSAIQKEINELLDEVDRIASTTEFNGTNLLDGTCNRVVTSDTIGITSLGVSSKVSSGEYELTVKQLSKPAEGTISYTIPAVGQTASMSINGTAILLDATDTDDTVYNKVMTVCNIMEIDVAKKGAAFSLTSRATGSNQSLAVRSTGQVTDTIYKGSDIEVKLGAGFSNNVSVNCSGDNIIVTDNSGFEMTLAAEDGVVAGQNYKMSVYDAGAMQLQIGANEHQDITIDFKEISCRTLMLRENDGDNTCNVCSQKGATNAITAFDQAISMVSAYRSNLGAMENRLESTISSLDTSNENMTDSMSRIMDTDMAQAMTDYTQESVLSQAATSILAQANNRPQQVMSLLQS